MTKPELVESVAAATGQAKPDIDRTLEAILYRVAGALAEGERVELRGFGIFEAKESKARMGRNPATRVRVVEPPSGPAKNSRIA